MFNKVMSLENSGTPAFNSNLQDNNNKLKTALSALLELTEKSKESKEEKTATSKASSKKGKRLVAAGLSRLRSVVSFRSNGHGSEQTKTKKESNSKDIGAVPTEEETENLAHERATDTLINALTQPFAETDPYNTKNSEAFKNYAEETKSGSDEAKQSKSRKSHPSKHRPAESQAEKKERELSSLPLTLNDLDELASALTAIAEAMQEDTENGDENKLIQHLLLLAQVLYKAINLAFLNEKETRATQIRQISSILNSDSIPKQLKDIAQALFNTQLEHRNSLNPDHSSPAPSSPRSSISRSTRSSLTASTVHTTSSRSSSSAATNSTSSLPRASSSQLARTSIPEQQIDYQDESDNPALQRRNTIFKTAQAIAFECSSKTVSVTLNQDHYNTFIKIRKNRADIAESSISTDNTKINSNQLLFALEKIDNLEADSPTLSSKDSALVKAVVLEALRHLPLAQYPLVSAAHCLDEIKALIESPESSNDASNLTETYNAALSQITEKIQGELTRLLNETQPKPTDAYAFFKAIGNSEEKDNRVTAFRSLLQHWDNPKPLYIQLLTLYLKLNHMKNSSDKAGILRGNEPADRIISSILAELLSNANMQLSIPSVSDTKITVKWTELATLLPQIISTLLIQHINPEDKDNQALTEALLNYIIELLAVNKDAFSAIGEAINSAIDLAEHSDQNTNDTESEQSNERPGLLLSSDTFDSKEKDSNSYTQLGNQLLSSFLILRQLNTWISSHRSTLLNQNRSQGSPSSSQVNLSGNLSKELIGELFSRVLTDAAKKLQHLANNSNPSQSWKSSQLDLATLSPQPPRRSSSRIKRHIVSTPDLSKLGTTEETWFEANFSKLRKPLARSLAAILESKDEEQDLSLLLREAPKAKLSPFSEVETTV